MAEDPTPPPQSPRDPGARGRQPVYEEDVEAGPSRLELADQARSSRNWAYGAAFLAILAAGLGAIAIIFAPGEDDDGGGGREGASQSSVSELREDVESLQERVDKVEEQSESADDVSGQVDQLESRVSELNSSQETLSDELSALEERVGQLEESRPAESGGGGDTTDGDAP